MKYRKKPVVIEAFRMGIDPRPDWFQSEVAKNRIITDLTDDEINDGNPWNHKKTCCIIKTLEGEMRGDYGDYIIQGVQGEIYPCKPDIFEATYEVAEKAKEGKTMTELDKQQNSYLEAKLQNSYRKVVELEQKNEDLRSLLDKASQAISCFVDLRGMSASELKSAHNGICILLEATKMLDAIKAGVGKED